MRADHLSQITSGEKPVGVQDDLSDAMLFMVETSPRWVEPIIQVLTTGLITAPGITTDAIAELERAKPYVLISGHLFKKGTDEVMRICINPEEYEMIMRNTHVSIGGLHLSAEQTVHRVMREGFWWPAMYPCALEFIRHCPQCKLQQPIPYATLYAISSNPRWNPYIVNYLQKGHIDPNLPRHRKKAIEVEVANYTLIGGQLYKRGRDNNLRL